jgi:hypothetical protein
MAPGDKRGSVKATWVALALISLLLSSVAPSQTQLERHGPFVPYPYVSSFAQTETRLFCGGSFENYTPMPPRDRGARSRSRCRVYY